MFRLSIGLPVSCCERGRLAVAPDTIFPIFLPSPFIQSSDPDHLPTPPTIATVYTHSKDDGVIANSCFRVYKLH